MVWGPFVPRSSLAAGKTQVSFLNCRLEYGVREEERGAVRGLGQILRSASRRWAVPYYLGSLESTWPLVKLSGLWAGEWSPGEGVQPGVVG